MRPEFDITGNKTYINDQFQQPQPLPDFLSLPPFPLDSCLPPFDGSPDPAAMAYMIVGQRMKIKI